jgi:hypothetical protein
MEQQNIFSTARIEINDNTGRNNHEQGQSERGRRSQTDTPGILPQAQPSPPYASV